MRTTLTIDDRLLKELKQRAHDTGRALKDIVNETLERGLASAGAESRARPYRLEPVSLGSPLPGIDLDRALRLADTLEDAEIGRDLELRK